MWREPASIVHVVGTAACSPDDPLGSAARSGWAALSSARLLPTPVPAEVSGPVTDVAVDCGPPISTPETVPSRSSTMRPGLASRCQNEVAGDAGQPPESRV